MKIIEPKVEEIKDFEGVDNFYKAVARAARICYASDKTDNDKELCKRLIEKKHFSPFAHAIISIDFSKTPLPYNKIIDCVIYGSKYAIRVHNDLTDHTCYYINGRIIVEYFAKHFSDDLIIKSIDEFLESIKHYNADKSIFKSFIVDTSIGCTREINRHHDNFYTCEQSTRYCNFCKDKFGGEISFNKPYWYDEAEEIQRNVWEDNMVAVDIVYQNLKGFGLGTDEIRGILPLDTHTRAIYTATIEEWKHFIDLRLNGITGKPHGDIKIIAEKINNLIFDKNIITV